MLMRANHRINYLEISMECIDSISPPSQDTVYISLSVEKKDFCMKMINELKEIP